MHDRNSELPDLKMSPEPSPLPTSDEDSDEYASVGDTGLLGTFALHQAVKLQLLELSYKKIMEEHKALIRKRKDQIKNGRGVKTTNKKIQKLTEKISSLAKPKKEHDLQSELLEELNSFLSNILPLTVLLKGVPHLCIESNGIYNNRRNLITARMNGELKVKSKLLSLKKFSVIFILFC